MRQLAQLRYGIGTGKMIPAGLLLCILRCGDCNGAADLFLQKLFQFHTLTLENSIIVSKQKERCLYRQNHVIADFQQRTFLVVSAVHQPVVGEAFQDDVRTDTR